MDEVSRGLGGQGFGQRKGRGAGTLPPDMVSAIGENLNSQMAASGTLGSPAGAIKAAMRFSGASEDIRHQRLMDSMAAVNQFGGASVMPSANQFLQVGANKASQAANLEMQAGEQIRNSKQAYYQELGSAVGQIGGLALGGGFGGMAGGMLGGGLFGGGGTQAGLNAQYAQGYRPPAAMAGYSPGGYGSTPLGMDEGSYGIGGFNPYRMFSGGYGPSYLSGTGY